MFKTRFFIYPRLQSKVLIKKTWIKFCSRVHFCKLNLSAVTGNYKLNQENFLVYCHDCVNLKRDFSFEISTKVK